MLVIKNFLHRWQDYFIDCIPEFEDTVALHNTQWSTLCTYACQEIRHHPDWAKALYQNQSQQRYIQQHPIQWLVKKYKQENKVLPPISYQRSHKIFLLFSQQIIYIKIQKYSKTTPELQRIKIENDINDHQIQYRHFIIFSVFFHVPFLLQIYFDIYVF